MTPYCDHLKLYLLLNYKFKIINFYILLNMKVIVKVIYSLFTLFEYKNHNTFPLFFLRYEETDILVVEKEKQIFYSKFKTQ